MTAATLLRQARLTSGVTQRRLASRAGTSQPRIAEIESGRHDPGVSRLERLLSASGSQLAVLPTRRTTVSGAAAAIRRHLSDGDEARAYRTLVQLNDDLAAEHGAVRVALTVAPPVRVGDRRFDVFIAALAEHHLDDEHLPHPEWVDDPSRVLEEPWRVDPFGDDDVEERTPESFLRRGIVLDRAELVSV